MGGGGCEKWVSIRERQNGRTLNTTDCVLLYPSLFGYRNSPYVYTVVYIMDKERRKRNEEWGVQKTGSVTVVHLRHPNASHKKKQKNRHQQIASLGWSRHPSLSSQNSSVGFNTYETATKQKRKLPRPAQRAGQPTTYRIRAGSAFYSSTIMVSGLIIQ